MFILVRGDRSRAATGRCCPPARSKTPVWRSSRRAGDRFVSTPGAGSEERSLDADRDVRPSCHRFPRSRLRSAVLRLPSCEVRWITHLGKMQGTLTKRGTFRLALRGACRADPISAARGPPRRAPRERGTVVRRFPPAPGVAGGDGMSASFAPTPLCPGARWPGGVRSVWRPSGRLVKRRRPLRYRSPLPALRRRWPMRRR